MNCWHCERPGAGTCRFCGRALCKDHAQTRPYIVSVYVDSDGAEKAVAVNNALWCGECDPRPEPITLGDAASE